MAPHPHETLLRDLYAALLGHNLATLQLLVAPQVVFHLPGRGEERGFERVFERWLELTQRSASKLELSLLDVLAGSHHAAALSDVTFFQGERAFTGHLVCLVRLEGRRIAECWLHTDALTATDAEGLPFLRA